MGLRLAALQAAGAPLLISILPPQKGLKFPEWWGVLEKKNPSVGKVWIFSGTTQCNHRNIILVHVQGNFVKQ